MRAAANSVRVAIGRSLAERPSARPRRNVNSAEPIRRPRQGFDAPNAARCIAAVLPGSRSFHTASYMIPQTIAARNSIAAKLTSHEAEIMSEEPRTARRGSGAV